MFVPSDKLKSKPLRWSTPEGESFGLGGDIHVTPTPPRLPYVVKEATQAQYEKAHKVLSKSFKTKNYINVVHSKVTKESDSGTDT